MTAAAVMGAVKPVKPDGTFEIENLIGTREVRVRGVPQGWLVKAILLEGLDIAYTPLELKADTNLVGLQVVLTNALSTLKGTVAGASSDCSILIFPEDGGPQHVRALARWLRPNQSGDFIAEDLLAGAYLAIAVTDVDSQRWPDADYVARFRERATRVVVGEKEIKTVTLQAGSTP